MKGSSGPFPWTQVRRPHIGLRQIKRERAAFSGVLRNWISLQQTGKFDG